MKKRAESAVDWNEPGRTLVGIYIRVSTTEQVHGFSLDDQESSLIALAQRSGWSFRLYRDDGITAETLEGRLGLQRLLGDVDAGVLSHVLVVDLSRLSRDTRVRGEIEHRLTRRKVTVVTPAGEFDFSEPESGFSMDVLLAAARFQSRLQAKKARQAKTLGAREGFWTAGPPPFGYRLIGDRKRRKLESNDAPFDDARGLSEADVVRMIFTHCAQERLGSHRLARLLDQKGVPPPSAWPGRHRKGRSGPLPAARFWDHSVIGRMLRDETYVGTFKYGRTALGEPSSRLADERRRGMAHRSQRPNEKVKIPQSDPAHIVDVAVPPLVDADLFTRCQEVLRSRAIPAPRTRRLYLLAGRIVCGRCGRSYYGTSRGERYAYYWCGGRHRRIPRELRCESRTLHAAIEDRVWAAVARLLEEPGTLEAAVAQSLEVEKGGSGNERVASLEKRLDELRVEGDRIARALRSGSMSEDRAGRMLREIETEEQAVRRRALQLRTWQVRGDRAVAQTKKIASVAARGRRALLNATPEKRQEVLHLLQVRVLVPPEGEPELEVHLPFERTPAEDLSHIVPPPGIEPGRLV